MGVDDEGLAIEDVLQELKTKFGEKSAEERAYIIMKVYFRYSDMNDGGEAGEKSKAMFRNWLLSPQNEEAKEKALERIFMEVV